MLIFQNYTILLTNKMDFHILSFRYRRQLFFPLCFIYRFTSNKTQLTEFPESKSDMPLFRWVLALKYRAKNICHAQKSQDTSG